MADPVHQGRRAAAAARSCGPARAAAAVVFMLATALCASPALAARLALLIGNDAYQHVSPLRNAVGDAQAMARVLERNGFDVTLVLNVGERDFKAAIRSFKAKVAGGDDVVVFYAGHGVQIGTANFLLPIDIRPDSDEQVRDESIALQRVLDDLDERRARFALAIVDACRDNPFRRTGRAIGGRGLAPTAPATGQMVIYSAGTGQQALDRLNESDREPNGVFTRVLIKELEKPGVPADRLIRNVRAEVARLARSARHDQVPAIYDQALGEFYFRPPAPAPDPAPAPAIAATPTPTPTPTPRGDPALGASSTGTTPAPSVPAAAAVAAAVAAAPSAQNVYPSYSNEDKDFGVEATSRPKRSPYHAPTPTSIPGGRVVKAAELVELLKADPRLVVIDVNNSKTRTTVRGAWWMASGGEAAFYGAERARFEEALKRVTEDDKGRAVVFLCVSSTCWLSYNAALLAIELGYTRVMWFRGGTSAWMGASQDLVEPKLLP